MSSIDRADPVILGHVLAEHRELFGQMQAVRAAYAVAGPPTRDSVAEIVTTLRSLREHLRSHFAQEEEGGFMEESIARMPRLAAQATAILSQHPLLLVQLDRLIDSTLVGGMTAAAWVAHKERFAGFAAQMQAHERSENAVLQDGYNEDLGLVD